VVDKVTVIENYTVSKGTNFGVGLSVFNNLTTGKQNTSIENLAARGEYKLTTRNNNVMVGYNLGAICEDGSYNPFLGCNALLRRCLA